MKNNKFALQIIVFGFIIVSFIACDKDFATLESDIINSTNATNFSFEVEPFEVITYNESRGPVQTNNLGLNINTLGVYDDSYGRTTSSFVTQLTTSIFDPTFGEEAVIDSVVLTLPFFSTAIDVEDDGNILYDIDSVIKRNPIKLSVFESNYFIRDFDPNGEFNEGQAYYSNKTASVNEPISEAALEGVELGFVEYNEESGGFEPISNDIVISDEGYILTNINELDEEGDPTLIERAPPGIRVLLEPTFWQNKIIDQEGEAVLSTQNNFSDYFRGLYFKAEPVNNDGSFLILNLGSQTAVVTIYYTRLTNSTTDEEDATDQSTFELSFGPSRINFMDNDFTMAIPNGDPVEGDSRLYLKGGEGSTARIKLFNGDDIDDSDDTTFEDFKSFFVETDDDGKFIKSRNIVNEANLVFYVDQDLVEGGEPNRVYLYDADNKTPLIDYFFDNNVSSLPSFSIINHLGRLERVDDEPNGEGIKYKLKITEHINNLLIRDSTNIDLGLAVSLNVNLEEFLPQGKVQNLENSDLTVPVSSVITPRGTVLHGNKTDDDSKKVYLEIYYTKPN